MRTGADVSGGSTEDTHSRGVVRAQSHRLTHPWEGDIVVLILLNEKQREELENMPVDVSGLLSPCGGSVCVGMVGTGVGTEAVLGSALTMAGRLTWVFMQMAKRRSDQENVSVHHVYLQTLPAVFPHVPVRLWQGQAIEA